MQRPLTQRKCAPILSLKINVTPYWLTLRGNFLPSHFLDSCVNMLCLPVLPRRLRYSHNLFVEASERCFQRHQHTFLFSFDISAYDGPLMSSCRTFFDAPLRFAHRWCHAKNVYISIRFLCTVIVAVGKDTWCFVLHLVCFISMLGVQVQKLTPDPPFPLSNLATAVNSLCAGAAGSFEARYLSHEKFRTLLWRYLIADWPNFV